jgi:enterobactin synthetase component D / holo-[acyl-carrier protein] synthase
MIEALLPPGAFGVEMRDTGQDVPLHAHESALVTKAVDKRRREFALGRACARSALAQMGVQDGAILRGADGAPLWPHGVVGSITHTDGYACAVVGAASRFAAMGVDAERIGGVGDELLPRLFDDSERARLTAMGAEQRRVAATLGFSAKEACFKAWRARFRDMHIEWGEGVFRTDRGEGRFLVQDGLALTAIFLRV